MSEETLDQITWEEVYAQEEEKMIKALAEAEKQEQERQKTSQQDAVQEQIVREEVIREEAMVVIYTLEKPSVDAYVVEKNHEVGCGCCKEW